MKRLMITAAIGLLLLSGCQQTQLYSIRDTQTQREYQSWGEPELQDNGSVAFKDVVSHHQVELQRYEIVGQDGATYKFEKDWTHRVKLEPVETK